MATLLAKLFGKKRTDSKESPEIRRRNSPNIKPSDPMQAYPVYTQPTHPATSSAFPTPAPQHYGDPRATESSYHKSHYTYDSHSSTPGNHQAGRGGEVDTLRSLANYDKIGMLGMPDERQF
jgi:hypothetical protein